MIKDPHWLMHDTKRVSIHSVRIVDRILPPTKARVNAMAKSLNGPLGLIQPILVVRYLSNAYRVVAGATRLMAALQLGWTQIRITVISADNDFELKLIEIAENMDRHDLSAAERTLLKTAEKEAMRARVKDLAERAKDVKKAKGGRGRKGGMREAARQAGVPKSTAHRQLKKLSQNKERDSLPGNPLLDGDPPEPKREPAMKTCPCCNGSGKVLADA